MIKHIVTQTEAGDVVYECNQAVRARIAEKVAINPDEATCKNCIRLNNKSKRSKK